MLILTIYQILTIFIFMYLTSGKCHIIKNGQGKDCLQRKISDTLQSSKDCHSYSLRLNIVYVDEHQVQRCPPEIEGSKAINFLFDYFLIGTCYLIIIKHVDFNIISICRTYSNTTKRCRGCAIQVKCPPRIRRYSPYVYVSKLSLASGTCCWACQFPIFLRLQFNNRS